MVSLLLTKAGGTCAVASLRTGSALQVMQVRWESAAGSPSAQKAPPTRQTSKTPVYPPGQQSPVYQPGQRAEARARGQP